MPFQPYLSLLSGKDTELKFKYLKTDACNKALIKLLNQTEAIKTDLLKTLFDIIGDDILIKSSNVKLNINNVCNFINHNKRAI